MKADMALPSTADYVVIGTGSAGAALAARLSEDPGSQVVALEAGPEDTNRFAHIPARILQTLRR